MIEVGEYVINQNRLVIGQIIEINEERQEAIIKVNRLELLIGFWNIKKHSKNIIDLLEEGDIVNGFSISKFDNEDGNEFLAIPIYNDAQLDCIEEVRPIATIKIKTILTHEQYMQNCYTVERKEE